MVLSAQPQHTVDSDKSGYDLNDPEQIQTERMEQCTHNTADHTAPVEKPGFDRITAVNDLTDHRIIEPFEEAPHNCYDQGTNDRCKNPGLVKVVRYHHTQRSIAFKSPGCHNKHDIRQETYDRSENCFYCVFFS